MQTILNWLRGERVQDPHARLIEEFIDWFLASKARYFYGINLAQAPAYQRIKADWTPEERIELLGFLIERIHWSRNAHPYREEKREHLRILAYRQLFQTLMRLRLIQTEAAALRTGEWLLTHQFSGHDARVFAWPIAAWLNDVKTLCDDSDGQLGPDLIAFLRRLEKRMLADLQRSHGACTREKQQLVKLRELLMGVTGVGEELPFAFVETDAYGSDANDLLAVYWPSGAIFPLLYHAATANGGKPSRKFRQRSRELLEALDPARVKETLRLLFERTLTTTVTEKQTAPWYYDRYLFAPINQLVLKGLAWTVAELDDAELSLLLVRVAEKAYRKVPGKGAPAAALGNACVWTLAHTPGEHGISQLGGLLTRVKQTNIRKRIDKYLSDAANQRGISRAEIDELLVPDHGLRGDLVTHSIGNYTTELRLRKPGRVELQWITPTGRRQKSVPAEVKSGYATELKQLKKRRKQLERDSIQQRDRLDWNLRLDRTLAKGYFEKYYLGNGLLRFFAERLIWAFAGPDFPEPVDVMRTEQGWVNAAGETVDVSAATEVRCWHPARATAAAVTAWRQYLLDREIQQPLKQAFREVYLLTEAELNTGTYSNRMAAHFLKQHQFASLARQRGWAYQLIGAFDHELASQACYQDLPETGMRAEFVILEVAIDDEYVASGIWRYVSTDAVQFVDLATGERQELAAIPAVLFSEIMRDVDLFVGVASIGNDPEWVDGGAETVHRDYWRNYAFGELTQRAQQRRLLLQRLVPRLKIRDVAEVGEKYLTVRGKIRTYQIHLGSGNIQMSPNNEYLCIVPDSRARQVNTEQVFLPFEGDRTLSIILSKALLLARDDKITDPTITRQIRRWS